MSILVFDGPGAEQGALALDGESSVAVLVGQPTAEALVFDGEHVVTAQENAAAGGLEVFDVVLPTRVSEVPRPQDLMVVEQTSVLALQAATPTQDLVVLVGGSTGPVGDTGPTGQTGQTGPRGPMGVGATAYYEVFTQASAATTWLLGHSFPYRPDVETYTPSGERIYADLTFPDDVTVQIDFAFPMTGTARLS